MEAHTKTSFIYDQSGTLSDGKQMYVLSQHEASQPASHHASASL